MTDTKKMAAVAFHALDEKMGEDIKVLDIRKISILADYFLIASGSSAPQINALIGNVEEKMHENGYTMKRMEGNKNSSWVLMDFGDIVVHVFNKEDRLFYNLERIWNDGIEIPDSEL